MTKVMSPWGDNQSLTTTARASSARETHQVRHVLEEAAHLLAVREVDGAKAFGVGDVDEGRAALDEDEDGGHAVAAGCVMGGGVAQLVWRGEQAVFVDKGWEAPASEAEIQSVRAFAADLAKCLSA